MILTIEQLAELAYGCNAVLKGVLGDQHVPEPWHALSPERRASYIRRAEQAAHDPAEQHQWWYEDRSREGWKWGAREDEEAKRHPNMVPFAALPPEQQLKDILYLAIIHDVGSYPG